MGLFKSRTQKEMELRSSVRRSIREMDKAIESMEKSRLAYIEKAKEAMRFGIKDQLALALAGLKSAIAQQTRIRSYKLNVEIMFQNWQTLTTAREFLGTMRGISRDMSKLTSDKEFAAAVKDFDVAIAENEKQTERIGDFLARSQDAFEMQSSSISSIKDEDIVSLLGEGEKVALSGKEDEMDALMRRIEKGIAGEIQTKSASGEEK